MASGVINTDNALKRLMEEMQAEMTKAAEPAIQAAVAEAEKVIRARVGSMCIALLNREFSVNRHGTDLVITVRGFGGDQRGGGNG